MVDTIVHPKGYCSVGLRQAPWVGVPPEVPRGSPTIRTHVPTTLLNDLYSDCVLVTDGLTTGWIRRQYLKMMLTHDRSGQGGHEKTKLRNSPSRNEDYVSPTVELTKGMNVALLDGSNGMSRVSTIVDGVVCTGWVQTSYLH